MSVAGSVDMEALAQEFRKLNTNGNTVINFANVNYLGSAALGALVTAHKTLKKTGFDLRLCNIQPQVHRVFAATRLTEVFQIYDEESEVVSEYRAQFGDG